MSIYINKLKKLLNVSMPDHCNLLFVNAGSDILDADWVINQ